MLDWGFVTEIFKMENLIALAITAVLSHIICNLNIIPQSILKLGSWKERKVFESVLVFKIQDESLREFARKCIFLILDGVGPIICIFLSVFVLIVNLGSLLFIKAMLDITGMLAFVMTLSFILMYIVQKSEEIFHKNNKFLKYLLTIVNINLLITAGGLLSLENISMMWGLYSICYFEVVLIISLVVKNIELPYSTKFVKRIRNIKRHLLMIMCIPFYLTEFAYMEWFMYIWLLICYIEYFSYLIGVGVTGKDVIIYLNDREIVTQKRIIQCKNGRVKYTSKNGIIVYVDENDIKCISYKYCNILHKRKNTKSIVYFADETSKEYNTYFYLTDRWIAFNKYGKDDKIVEIYKISDIREICTVKSRDKD